MNLLHRVIVQDQLIAADSVMQFDMGTNPLSVIIIALRPLNDTGTLSNFVTYRTMCAALNRITLLHRGASVFSMRGEDAQAINYFRHGIVPSECSGIDTNDFRRCMILPILLGRRAYDVNSCFPSTLRGELQLEMDIDIADTGYDGLRISVESIELIGARPREFERKTNIAKTFASTGDNDVDLPAGNVVRGLLLWGTTSFSGAVPAPSWGRISTLLDGRQVGFASTDFEVHNGMNSLRGMQPFALDVHQHRVDAQAASGTEATTKPFEHGTTLNKNCFLDFDPTRDDQFSINTRGAANWVVRADAETADAVRVTQIERIAV
ncbi:MAG: hypothetical protein A2W19_01360 [Spirochaetes bacterium RBG_16_49_21]|nr:MAG: hypothetical protein A2W19_01360 [Spirochaetes bacterium RBG_16_49_21]